MIHIPRIKSRAEESILPTCGIKTQLASKMWLASRQDLDIPQQRLNSLCPVDRDTPCPVSFCEAGVPTTYGVVLVASLEASPVCRTALHIRYQ